MRAIGTMASTTTINDRVVESKVSRAGDEVSIELTNTRGDVIRCAMSAEGDCTISLHRDGRQIGAIVLAKSGAMGAVGATS